ncbi:diaminopimelate epimerase [Streptomyces sp. HSW2009]|uniref:diaminopimelate epimerase n=1 Tax=Streptomyces sp. HSW2009 TaxID=3142890 RepID=UPI0032EF6868
MPSEDVGEGVGVPVRESVPVGEGAPVDVKAAAGSGDGAGAGRTIAFTKLVAAGNDFLVLDVDHQPPPDHLAAFARHVCPAHEGVGADGVVVVRSLGVGRIGATVINPDGSVARMCGNGVRCAARYAIAQGAPTPLAVEFAGRDRLHSLVARPVGELLEVSAPTSGAVSGPVTIDGLDYHWLDTGTEYAVAFVADVDAYDANAIGRTVRHHPHFQPAGTSVCLAQVTPDGLRVRTYERGNETETLSCGSGAVACAQAAHHLGLVTGPRVRVDNRAGTPLSVRLAEPEPQPGLETDIGTNTGTDTGRGSDTGTGRETNTDTGTALAGPARITFTGAVAWPA